MLARNMMVSRRISIHSPFTELSLLPHAKNIKLKTTTASPRAIRSGALVEIAESGSLPSIAASSPPFSLMQAENSARESLEYRLGYSHHRKQPSIKLTGFGAQQAVMAGSDVFVPALNT